MLRVDQVRTNHVMDLIHMNLNVAQSHSRTVRTALRLIEPSTDVIRHSGQAASSRPNDCPDVPNFTINRDTFVITANQRLCVRRKARAPPTALTEPISNQSRNEISPIVVH